MKKWLAFLIMAVMISVSWIALSNNYAVGEDSDVLYNDAGTTVDGGLVSLTNGGGMDTQYYFRVGKNVPISSAYINISTYDTINGNAIQDPYVDIGVDGQQDWKYEGVGYGKFGEQTLFSDDNEKTTINMPSGGGYDTQNSIIIPQGAEINSAEVDVQGRFIPERITAHTIMQDPSKDVVQIQIMETGDIDGDGDEDVVVSDIQKDRLVWFENPGNASKEWPLHVITTSYYVQNAYGLDVGDIDGDGDPDIACSSYSRGYVMYLRNNNGGSSWSIYRFKTGFGYAGTVKLADMDQDDDLDIVVVTWYNRYYYSDEFLYWYEAPSNPNTTSWSQHKIGDSPYYYMYTYFGMDVGDVNGDGYPDVVASTYPQYSYYGYNYLHYYQNPKTKSGSWSKTTVDSTAQRIFSLEIADMDNDGDGDVIAASYDGRAIKYYNKTSTGWSERTIHTVYNPRYVKVTDFDGDGYNDTFFSGGSGNYEFSYLRQDGTTTSWTKTVLTNQVIVPQAFSILDIDNDNDKDFWVTGTSASQLVQIITDNATNKQFTLQWIYEGGIKDIRYMDYMNMDDDDDLDMVFISYDTGYIGWWENDNETDGDPMNSVGSLHQLGVLGNGIKLMLADVDGDEDKDIVAINSGGAVKWFRNDNDPYSMWDSYIIASNVPTPLGFYVGDFTGDGKADVATSTDNYYQAGYVRLYECPSDPTQEYWSYNTVSTGISYLSNIWADDLDLDGDLEIIVLYGAYGSGSALYLKNPTVEGGDPMAGAWNANQIGGGMYYPEDVKTIDINDDGYPDVVVTGSYYYSKVRWFENPGRGGSWKSRILYSAAYDWYLAVGDIGSDGYADIVFSRGSSSSPSSIIWLEEPDDLDSSWITHSVGSYSGTNDLGIADLENDGIQEILSTSTSLDEIRAYKVDALYPSEFSMDIGADESTPDNYEPGNLKGKYNFDFASALQDTVNTPGGSIKKFSDNYGTELLEIPIEIYSNTIGKIALDNIKISYNASVKIDQNGKGEPLAQVIDRLIPDYTDDEVYTRVYVGVGGSSKGMAYLSDFYVEFNAIPRQVQQIREFDVDEDTVEVVSDDLSQYFRDDYTDPENLELEVFVKGPKRNMVDVYLDENNRLVVDSTITENFYTRSSDPYDISAFLVVTDDGGPNGVPPRSMRTKEFPIFVNPMNDAPENTGEMIPTLYAWEGRTTTVLDLDDYDLFYDVDGDQLFYLIRSDLEFEGYNESAGFQIKRINSNNTLEVSLNERSDWTGTVHVTLYASDDNDFNFNQDPRVEFDVEVRNINDGPLWGEIPKVVVTEDIENDRVIELSQYAFDFDSPRSDLEILLGDYTNLSFLSLQVRKTENGNFYLGFRPKLENWVGGSTITLHLTDGEFTTTTTMEMVMEPVNDLPTLRILEPSENGKIDPGTFSIVGEAYDVEGLVSVEVLYDGVWYTATGTNSWGVTLISVGTYDFQENVPIQVRCFDGEYYYTDYVNITILPIPIPVILDRDGDEVDNSLDAFPDDAGEWADTDRDGYGDNEDAFPLNPAWHSDLDKDGIADVAEDPDMENDPENRVLTDIQITKKEEKPDLFIPIVLSIIVVILALILILSIVAYRNKRAASLDPKKMVKYYARQQRFRERRHEFIEKLPFAKAMDNVTDKLGGGGPKPSSGLPTPSGPGGPTPTMVRQPMTLQPRPGMQQMPQRQLPPRPPQQ